MTIATFVFLSSLPDLFLTLPFAPISAPGGEAGPRPAVEVVVVVRMSAESCLWHGGTTPRAAPALCHLIPDPQPLTPPCRSHCRHARAVQSVDSGTLDFAVLLAGRRKVIAQLAGRLGSAGAAAAWPPLRAGWTCKQLPTWRRPASLSPTIYQSRW